MNRNRASVLLLIASLFVIAAIAGFGSDRYSGSAADRGALKTSVEIQPPLLAVTSTPSWVSPSGCDQGAGAGDICGPRCRRADVVGLLSHYHVNSPSTRLRMYFKATRC
jgi:hypothetical protein